MLSADRLRDMSDELNTIRQQLADHPPIVALATALRSQPRARLHVAPALSAARAGLAAALAGLAGRPLLYGVGSAEAALRAREDLCVWLGPESVLLFPAGDALPYEQMSPGIDVIAGRLRVLRQLRERVFRRTRVPVSMSDE
jgi:transcription-repair coupling factor (superfamily II helicase)